jgi:hypothetical protein
MATDPWQCEAGNLFPISYHRAQIHIIDQSECIIVIVKYTVVIPKRVRLEWLLRVLVRFL